MIFVTVGHASWGFVRLIEEMDCIAGKIDEKVIIQIGHTNYEPKNAKYFRFTSNEEIEELYMNVRVIVSHAGVGTIVSAIRRNKPIIVVPRRMKYGEHFDDHQVEIARELERERRIKVVWDIEELEEALNSPLLNSSMKIEKNEKLVRALRGYINGLTQ